MTIKERFYSKSPVFIQNIMCSLYGYIVGRKRFGGEFDKFYNFLVSSEWLGAAEISLYKEERLKEVLRLAKEIDYYSIDVNCGEDGFNPCDVLSGIPILSKEDVVENYAKIAMASEGCRVNTSGTTGKSLAVRKTSKDISMQWAIWLRHRHRFGIRLNDLSVNFTGKLVVPSNQVEPPYWRYNRAQNQYLINMQHVNEKNITSIVSFLNSISPRFYSGYPSIISEVARLARGKKIVLNESSKPKVIFCGAENTLDYQSSEISKFTDAIITDQYGLTEGCCNLSKCLHGYYHEDFEFCDTELIDEEELPDGRKRGRLIGTGFYNEAFPLLRYDTGDIAIAMPDGFKCPCGRHSKVFHSIEGRIDDYVLTVDGRKIMRFDYLFKDTSAIEEAQVVQNELNKIVIRIKLRSSENIGILEKTLSQRVKDIICPSLSVEFSYIDIIEKSSTGKFKAVVNNLKS